MTTPSYSENLKGRTVVRPLKFLPRQRLPIEIEALMCIFCQLA